ncbi:prolyl aminopeptidase [Pontibaca salina]|uniref:Proline iminopeptidase n=1 Tax=Pontibaca salina TaxID=2795731 RepID=A0A934LZM9_9RHOB|nr:prolyl aminopeptidase [Pontibaca salina]MBI6629155.1 prolyl aminopeptidase [Pontibaca salina]
MSTGHVAVGDGHELYVETSGDIHGTPIVFLHGGPGSGAQAAHRKLFPESAYLVMFDQRGAGLSRPKGSRAANTTDHLIADMEKLRAQFGIDKWIVVGGSWGATLALAYAQRHPQQTLGLVLRSIFLGTRTELETAFCDNLAMFHPALHADFLALLPESERARPLDAYWAHILDNDTHHSRRFALAWHDTERILSQIAPTQTRLDPLRLNNRNMILPASPFMEAHYFSYDCFLKNRPLLQNAPALAEIPGIIVQARYDLLCPPSTSHRLAARWSGVEIRYVGQAGHSINDGQTMPAMQRAIIDMIGHIAP